MKNSVTKIKTENLILRILEISDASDLQALLADNKSLMVPWIPWALEEPQSVEDKIEKIIEWRTEFMSDTKYIYGVFIENVLIGLIFLFTRQGPGKLEIGYIIDKNHTGKGYATEASYALTKLGFEVLTIDQMVIHCNANNTASAKIPEKLGYNIVEKKKEGPDEMLIWSCSIEEFRAIIKYEPVTFIQKKANQNV